MIEDTEGKFIHKKLLYQYIDWIQDDDCLAGSRLQLLKEKLEIHKPLPNQEAIDESYRKMMVYQTFMDIEKQKVMELIQNET